MKVTKINNIIHYRTLKKAYLSKGDNFKYSEEDSKKLLKDMKMRFKKEKEYKVFKKNNYEKLDEETKDRILEKILENLQNSIENNRIKIYNKESKEFIYNFLDCEGDILIWNVDKKFDEFYKEYKLKECLENIVKNYKNQNNFKLKDIKKNIFSYRAKYLSDKYLAENKPIPEKEKILINGLYNELSSYFRNQLLKLKLNSNDKNKKIEKIFNEKTICNILKNRISNKITLYFIFQGKLKYYGIGENVDTTILNNIKLENNINKYFLKSFITVSKKLKLIYNENNMKDEDILLSNINDNLLPDNNLTKLILGIKNNNYDEVKKNVCIFHNTIRELRNNLFHFKKLNDFTINESDKEDIKKLLKEDIENLKSIFIDNLKKLNIIDCFGLENKKYNFFDNINLDDNFTNCIAPSFSKIYIKGNNMYNYKKNNEYEIYKKLENNKENLAQKNLLQLIYKYNFLPNLNNGMLEKSINAVIKRNESVNKKIDKNNKEKIYKYNQIEKIWKNYNKDKIFEFFKEIQKQEMIKSNNLNKNNKKNQYTDFIQDVYAHCFNKYYNDKLKEFKEEKNINDIKFNKTNLDDLNELNNYILAFYCLFKFLSNYEIGELQSQIKKYFYIYEKNEDNNKDKKEIFNQLNKIIQIVKINKSVSNIENITSDMLSLKDIEGFFENNVLNEKCYKNIYFQDDKIICYKGILDLILSGNKDLYLKMFENYKITKNDLNKYLKYNEKVTSKNLQDLNIQLKLDYKFDNDKSIIEFLHCRRENLHKNIMQNENYKKETIDKETIDEYKELVKHIKNYDNIKNKITFVYLSNIRKIEDKILSRYISFIVDWERDILFLLLGLDLNNEYQEQIKEMFSKGYVLRNIKENLDYGFKEYIFKMYCGEGEFSNEKFNHLIDTKCKIRNNIAHMNMLYKNESMLHFILPIQNLMSYDRKKRNSITKVINKIFDKENIIIKYNINSKEIFDITFESKEEQHLKGKININNKKSGFKGKINTNNNKKGSLKIDIHNKDYMDLLSNNF